ncbi:MAG: hypothetical protein AAF957_11135 [Planctomycetota bacterium]
MKSPIAALLLPLVLSASAVAQQTWVVDSMGGPGSDFTTIDAAIQASSNGDLILVEAGSYAGFRLDRSVRIIGRGSVTTTTRSFVIAVNGSLPACVANLRIDGLQVQSCSSTIVLTDCTELLDVTVDSCADVRFARCGLVARYAGGFPWTGWTAVRFSRAEFSDCTIVGMHLLWDATEALELVSSFVHLAGTSVTGLHGLEPCTGWS